MRLGKLISVPDEYSRFARIIDDTGVAYTVEPSDLPDDVSEGEELAYKVEIWGNDSGLAYGLEKL